MKRMISAGLADGVKVDEPIQDPEWRFVATRQDDRGMIGMSLDLVHHEVRKKVARS